jgi:hypothetical protein
VSPPPRRTSRAAPWAGTDAAGWFTWAVVVAAAIALAVYTYAATMAASSANGEWQDAVRAEARHTSATLENIRSVYEDEAPLALSITAALVRAQELDRRVGAGSFLGVQADAERDTARAYLDTFRREVPDSPVTRLLGSRDDPEAVARTHPLGTHLATLQASSRQATDAAAALWATGDRDATRTRGFLWGMVGGALVVLAGFVLWEQRQRSALATAGWTAQTATVAMRPGPWPGVALTLAALIGAQHGTRRPALPARVAAAMLAGAAVGGVLLRRAPAPIAGPVRTDQGDGPVAVIGPPPVPAAPPERPAADRSPLPAVVLAVAAVVVTALQIDASTTENLYLAAAAQGADRVGTVSVGGGAREAFASNGQQLVVLMQQRADDVADAGSSASAADRALAEGLADADRAASARIATAIADLATPPTTADGLDPLSVAAVSASEFDREPEQRAQAAAAAEAEAAGARSDGLVRVLLALTLAANFVEIGHSSRLKAAGPVVVGLGWALTAVAAVLAALTLLAG